MFIVSETIGREFVPMQVIPTERPWSQNDRVRDVVGPCNRIIIDVVETRGGPLSLCSEHNSREERMLHITLKLPEEWLVHTEVCKTTSYTKKEIVSLRGKTALPAPNLTSYWLSLSM